MAESPHVVGILAIADPRRVAIAMTAVNNFLYQTYRNCSLVVANSSGKRVTNRTHPAIREVEYPEGISVSELRQRAVQDSAGDFYCLWNDDEHGHPHRIAMQMAHRGNHDGCVMLRHAVKIDVRNVVVVYSLQEQGHPQSVLWPAFANATFTEGPNSEREFVDNYFSQSRQVVLPNGPDWFPGPCLLLRFWHGLNEESREDFLGGEYADPSWFNKARVNQDTVDYVTAAMALHNMRVDIRSSSEEPVAAVN